MKKFSDKYINNWDVLKNARIGFEFEFYTDKSYYKLLEFLNRELEPIVVSGFRVYHSSFKPSKTHFKIEPDLSLGHDGVELITGPLDYVNAKPIMLKILKILQTYSKVDERCSIHINVSFDEKKTEHVLNNLDLLKLILEIDEEYIYKLFPTRRNNVYAKSIKKLIPFKGYDYAQNAISLMKSNLEIPETKYYGVNLTNVKNGRLEYRYIGGKDYINKSDEILELLDYFVLLTHKCISEPFNDENSDDLKDYLSTNINNFKTYKNFESFIANFPTIVLQADRNGDFAMVQTYYASFYEELYELILNTKNLKDCVINYDSSLDKLEIVDAEIKLTGDLSDINFVECNIKGGTIKDCMILNCVVTDSYISKSDANGTKLKKCKIESSNINSTSEVIDSYMFNSFLNGTMTSGVFRSGKIGESGTVSKKVKIVTIYNNYFLPDTDIDDKDITHFKNKSVDKNKFLNSFGLKKEVEDE